LGKGDIIGFGCLAKEGESLLGDADGFMAVAVGFSKDEEFAFLGGSGLLGDLGEGGFNGFFLGFLFRVLFFCRGEE